MRLSAYLWIKKFTLVHPATIPFLLYMVNKVLFSRGISKLPSLVVYETDSNRILPYGGAKWRTAPIILLIAQMEEDEFVGIISIPGLIHRSAKFSLKPYFLHWDIFM